MGIAAEAAPTPTGRIITFSGKGIGLMTAVFLSASRDSSCFGLLEATGDDGSSLAFRL